MWNTILKNEKKCPQKSLVWKNTFNTRKQYLPLPQSQFGSSHNAYIFKSWEILTDSWERIIFFWSFRRVGVPFLGRKATVTSPQVSLSSNNATDGVNDLFVVSMSGSTPPRKQSYCWYERPFFVVSMSGITPPRKKSYARKPNWKGKLILSRQLEEIV